MLGPAIPSIKATAEDLSHFDGHWALVSLNATAKRGRKYADMWCPQKLELVESKVVQEYLRAMNEEPQPEAQEADEKEDFS